MSKVFGHSASLPDEYNLLTDEILEALDRYVQGRVLPGSWLTGCLENNLINAVVYMSPRNFEVLYQLVKYMLNYLPALCWGSKEKVTKWMEG